MSSSAELSVILLCFHTYNIHTHINENRKANSQIEGKRFTWKETKYGFVLDLNEIATKLYMRRIYLSF